MFSLDHNNIDHEVFLIPDNVDKKNVYNQYHENNEIHLYVNTLQQKGNGQVHHPIVHKKIHLSSQDK